MAASLTHLVCGQQVFSRLTGLDSSQPVFGSFLKGCTLVDVHAFHEIERSVTHFAGHLGNAATYDARKSCDQFLAECPQLLVRPWNTLADFERAFAAGYLCHLAADECWKALGKKLFAHLGISRWTQMPVHPDVILTAFDFLCRRQMENAPQVLAALDEGCIPDVFSHVSHDIFVHQWRIVEAYLKADGSPESYREMLQRSGKPEEEINLTFEQRFSHWDEALGLLDEAGGVSPFLDCAVSRGLEVIPELWDCNSGG